MTVTKHTQRGFTVLEMVIATSIFLVLLGTAVVAISVDTRAGRVLVAQVSPEIAARTAMERMTTELRMAGIRGEDRNGDGVLQDSEDLNENGEMDSDWNLEDGKSQDTLTFNRRIEVQYTKDDEVFQSEYSRAVTFKLDDERLVREATETINGVTRTTTVVLARPVTRLAFSRDSAVIKVELDVRLPKDVYKADTRTLIMNVRLRN